MNQVVIIDDRPKWMIKEDKHMACMLHCHLYRHCQTRAGRGCKRLGGKEIPKIRRS